MAMLWGFSLRSLSEEKQRACGVCFYLSQWKCRDVCCLPEQNSSLFSIYPELAKYSDETVDWVLEIREDQ